MVNHRECLKTDKKEVEMDFEKLTRIFLALFERRCHRQANQCKKHPEKIGELKSISTPDCIQNALMRYYNEKGGDKNRTIPIALYDKLRKYLN